MRRRSFLVGGLCAAAVSRASAQELGKVRRIAIIHPELPVTEMTATGGRPIGTFFTELQRLGFVEGRNLEIARFTGEGRQQFAELARAAVRIDPEVILAVTTILSRALKAETATIPIVGITGDPVAGGLVANLAEPGGNVTGVVVDAGLEIWGKRLELLREAAPRASRLAYLATAAGLAPPYDPVIPKAAAAAGFSFIPSRLDPPIGEQTYRRAFSAMTQAGVDACLVGDGSVNQTNAGLIGVLAADARLPGIHANRVFVERGGLMSYGADPTELWRHAAGAVAAVLHGERPGRIPFYQASKFELLVNLKAATALGLTIPTALLLRADEVIE